MAKCEICVHVAGAVKSNKIKKGATSDFMEIERQRGISVASASRFPTPTDVPTELGNRISDE